MLGHFEKRKERGSIKMKYEALGIPVDQKYVYKEGGEVTLIQCAYL